MAALITALPKGRLLPEVLALLRQSNFISNELVIEENSRQLIFTDPLTGYAFLLAKPKDVPVYVEHGAADIGITGKDVIREHGKYLYEMLDLEVGLCKLVVAAPECRGIERLDQILEHSRVATSYPGITRDFFNQHGIQVEIIRLNGSVELAPLIDLADLIVDLSSSGCTLRENKLITLAEVLTSSARLIVNKVSYKTKYQLIGRLIESLKEGKGKEDAAILLSNRPKQD